MFPGTHYQGTNTLVLYIDTYSYLCIFCHSVFTSLSLSHICVCVCIHYIFYIYKIYPLPMHQASLSRGLLDDFIWMSNWCLKVNMFETDLWTFPLNLLYPKSSLSLKITTPSLQLLSLRTSRLPFHPPFLTFKIQFLTYSVDSTFITCFTASHCNNIATSRSMAGNTFWPFISGLS